MSDKAESPEKRDFELVKDPQEALKFLREATKSLASATLWTKGQEFSISTNMLLFDEGGGELAVTFPPDRNPQELRDAMKAAPSEAYFSVSIARANLFFKATYVSVDSKAARFKAPLQVFKVQRRKDLRLPIPEGYAVKVEFSDPLFPEKKFSRKLIDLSGGGFSFFAPQEDETVFHPGTSIHGISFSVKGRAIRADGEVRHIRPFTSVSITGRKEDGLKVGIQFQKLRQADSQAVAAYVFEEYRKYFSRFI